jgi:hypothetical protein
VVRDQIEAIKQRDQALLKLSDLTRASLFVATALLAAFSVIAAVTIPGQSQATASTPTNSSDSFITETSDSGQPLQAPTTGPLRRGSGRPIAVSGGSH